MKIVFMGTPEFGRIVLERLLDSDNTVLCVVCQPDKLGNRNKLKQCEVKSFALSKDIAVYDWQNVSEDGVETLKTLGADVFVTAAYGQMLSEEILSVAPHGVINVHGSLLPKYRGASPIQRAVMDGLTTTGVTIVKTALKMDAGDIVAQATAEILPSDTADDMFLKLAKLGGDLLVKTLDDIKTGKATFTPQDEKQVTLCKKIKAEEEIIDWSMPADKLSCKIRGLSSVPAAYSVLNGKRFKVYNCRVFSGDIGQPLKEGEIHYEKKQMIVGCGNGTLLALTDVQAAEGKRMAICDFLNGLKNRPQKFDRL